MDLAPSLNKPFEIEAFGFEHAGEAAHMFPWLGRGNDFRRFVTNDVEGELYARTPGAQLLLITCAAPPQLETTARMLNTSGERGEDQQTYG